MIDFTSFDEKIIIAPFCLKPLFLSKKRLNPGLNFKILSLEDLEKICFGSLKDDALSSLFNNTKYDYNFIKNVCLQLQKGFNKDFNQDTKNIFNFLKDNNLLKKEEYEKYLFNDKKVIFIAYNKNQNEVKNVIKELNLKEVEFLDVLDLFDEKDQYLYQFENIDEEIRYVLTKIIDLINSGISPNDILLITDIENNYYLLEVFAKEIGLKLNYQDSRSIYDTQIAKLIEKNLVNLTLENIDSYDDSSEEFKIIKEILSRFNILTKENKLLNYRTILKEHPLNNIDESGVKVTTNLIFNENKYIFVTNLDNHFYLKIKKNNDLFDDLVKLKNGVDISDDLNLINDNLYFSFLNLSNKLYLSMSKNSFLGQETVSFYFQKKYQSYFKYLKSDSLNYDYSKTIAKAYYSHFLYLKKYFKYINEEYYLYHNYFKEIDEYDNSYSRVSSLDFDKITTSYSNLELFYECPFKYYCTKILQIDEFQDTFYTKCGNFIHQIMENIYKVDFDFEESFSSLIDNYEFTKKEKIFLSNIKDVLKIVVLRLINEKKNSKISKTYQEKNLLVKIKDDFILTGKVDSILVASNNEFQACQILDYKTGKIDLSTKYYEYGLNLQLPIYAYLISNDSNLKNLKISGIYYLCFNIDSLLYKEDIHYDNKINELVIKNGQTIDDLDTYLLFEPKLLDYLDSKAVYGLSYKDKRLKSKRLISNDESKNYNNLISQIIEYFYKSIKEADFVISPFKEDSNENGKNACKYCNLKDICFKKEKDYRKLKGLFEVNK